MYYFNRKGHKIKDTDLYNQFKKNEENNLNDITKYAQIIKDISYQTHELLKNLLDWSLTQTGNIAFNPKLYSLSLILCKELVEKYGLKVK